MRKASSPKGDVFSAFCPSRAILGQIANKWSCLIIDALSDGRPMRNGALLRRIDGVSQKMLTQTLRDLECLNLIERRTLGSVPPHVDYQLTSLGRSLRDAVCVLDRWVEDHLGEIRCSGSPSPKVSAGTRAVSARSG